jgi:hypothetical protein
MAALVAEEADEHLVPFALDRRGGSWAMDLSRRQNGSCQIVRVKRGQQVEDVAESFSAWLEHIERQESGRDSD